jgi:hypothetical protein
MQLEVLAVVPLNRAARRVGVPPGWLRQEAAAGRVPCLRAGHRFVFEVDSLATALATRIRQQAAEEAVPK